MSNLFPDAATPNHSLADLEPIYQSINAAQTRLIAKGSSLDGLYSVGILLQYITGIKRQITGLKDELAEQEKQKLTLIRELAASEKYRHLLTKAILHTNPIEPAQ